MTRLRHWLEVFVLPPIAFALGILAQVRAPETWHDDLEQQLAAYEDRPPWR